MHQDQKQRRLPLDQLSVQDAKEMFASMLDTLLDCGAIGFILLHETRKVLYSKDYLETSKVDQGPVLQAKVYEALIAYIKELYGLDPQQSAPDTVEKRISYTHRKFGNEAAPEEEHLFYLYFYSTPDCEKIVGRKTFPKTSFS